MWLWLVAFGWCASFSATIRQKLLSSAAVVCLSAISYFLGHSVLWYTTVAAICIVWLEVIPIRLPRFLVPIMTGAAGASLFIYLTHFQFRSLLRHLLWFHLGGGLPTPWLSVAFSMVGGFFVWRAWNFASQQAVRPLRRMGVRLHDVRILPTDGGL
jgi:hypothetical protein